MVFAVVRLRTILTLAVVIGLPARVLAQATPQPPIVPTKPPVVTTKPGAPRTTIALQSYDEASSRAAFAAVDRDADDRLSIFEFASGQDEPAAADPRDTTVFRRLDVDRDGFLNWPEFDARVQSTIRLSGQFRYRPARVLPTPRRATPTPRSQDAQETRDAQVEGLLALLDTDHSGKVSRDEFSTLLSSSGMPAANHAQFVEADRDADRELDPKELGTLLQLLPNLPRGPQVHASSKSFSAAWRRADVDGDGEVSATELASVLRAHDLHLGKWADRVVADADRSGDRHLGPAEVVAANPKAALPTDKHAGDTKKSDGASGKR